ncbi:MAG: GNAT family N-acetyltransferase [Fimbriimonadaceae bacterium]|nr:MAG: GNAT family N-acetyltransferase [Fimbriimonadaceae bacterium]
MLIRLAIDSDAVPLAQVKIQSWRKGYANIISAEHLSSLSIEVEAEKFRTRIEQGDHLLVADSNSKVVAYSLWMPYPFNEDWPHKNMLASLYVLPEYEGQGIATSLIRENAAHSLSQGFSGMMIGVFAENARAKSLYIHLGAEFFCSGTFEVGGIPYPDEIYAFNDLLALTAR